jgi:hypothetical protein
MTEGTPARIDRAALDRIIQRAAELQTAERDIGDSLSPDEVMALGREVGIPGRYLQQALLEERTRLANVTPAGAWERVVGPSQVTAQRVVRGDPDSVEVSLLRWVEDNELLCILRQQPGRITWEPLTGFQAAIRRSTAAFHGTKRPFTLSRADTVSATVLGLEPGWSHVALTATARKARTAHLGGGAAFAGAGALTAILMIVLGAFVPIALIPAPVGLGIGYGFLRGYHPVLARLQLGLESALDSLEQRIPSAGRLPPARPPRIIDLLASEIRKALKS